jgi:hypothetical protein
MSDVHPDMAKDPIQFKIEYLWIRVNPSMNAIRTHKGAKIIFLFVRAQSRAFNNRHRASLHSKTMALDGRHP